MEGDRAAAAGSSAGFWKKTQGKDPPVPAALAPRAPEAGGATWPFPATARAGETSEGRVRWGEQGKSWSQAGRGLPGTAMLPELCSSCQRRLPACGTRGPGCTCSPGLWEQLPSCQSHRCWEPSFPRLPVLRSCCLYLQPSTPARSSPGVLSPLPCSPGVGRRCSEQTNLFPGAPSRSRPLQQERSSGTAG